MSVGKKTTLLILMELRKIAWSHLSVADLVQLNDDENIIDNDSLLFHDPRLAELVDYFKCISIHIYFNRLLFYHVTPIPQTRLEMFGEINEE